MVGPVQKNFCQAFIVKLAGDEGPTVPDDDFLREEWILSESHNIFFGSIELCLVFRYFSFCISAIILPGP